MKPLLSALFTLGCTITLLCSAASAQQPGPAISRPGLFSYRIPPGWRALTLAKIENPLAVDFTQLETNPYIQVDTAVSAKSLAEFTVSNKQSMKVMVPSTQFVEQAPFVTAAGVQGIRIVATAHPGEDDRKAIYYLFEGPKNLKVIVFANVMPAGFERNAPIFDAAVKTLELGR